MGAVLSPAWHLDLLLVGAAVGAAATFVALVLRVGPPPAVLASVAAVATLVTVGPAPWWLPVVLAAAALVLARGATGPRGTLAGGVAVVAIVAGADPAGLAAAAVVAAVGWLVVATGRGGAGVRALPRGGPDATVAAAAAALWLCTPDTEAVVVVGAALAAPLVAGFARPASPGAPTWAAPALAVAWAGAVGFAGRPAGLIAMVPIFVAATGWAWVRPLRPASGRSGWALGCIGAGGTAVVAARTVGLATSVTIATVAVGAGLTALALVSWCAAPAAAPRAPDDGARGRAHR